jgi:hypothetical protein
LKHNHPAIAILGDGARTDDAKNLKNIADNIAHKERPFQFPVSEFQLLGFPPSLPLINRRSGTPQFQTS